ncbi:MAG: tRNA pseudouridine(55) synthase TruB [Gemmatimonadetes bacterium]|nr:tRNA pseudouridine(55) synthase TruB [Gemmatimonadota bacterium]
MTGILLVDKPTGPTSHDVVAMVRRALNVRRVGHFGTLDPFASGLLVLGVGPATRLATFAVDHPKTYLATVRLGATSTTDDAEGEIEETAAAPAPREAVETVCATWLGEVEQIPPAYSAKHVAGARAYALARAGEAVVLPSETVSIDRIQILRYEWPDLVIEVDCGPGTYLRALARDLGEALSTGGYCRELRRTRSGPFEVGQALDASALGEPGRAEAALLSAESAVVDRPAVELDASAAAAAANGGRVAAPDSIPPDVRWARLRGPGGFVGMAERVEGDGRAWLQPRRILYPEGETAWPPAERSP